jgi:protein-S-isoprenylcysteine O-methyltransferase Ste14
VNDNLILAVGIAVLALMLCWAWLTSLEMLIFVLTMLATGIYTAFMIAIGLQERERIMQEERRQEEPKKQICVLPN